VFNVLLQAPVFWVGLETSGEASSLEGSQRLDICIMQPQLLNLERNTGGIRFMQELLKAKWNKLSQKNKCVSGKKQWD
jgi:hypothetical protein